MTRQTLRNKFQSALQSTLPIALLAATLAAPAAANQFGPLYQVTGQVRGQLALVRAHADATFTCPDSRFAAADLYHELDGLCRDLDRFEQQLARPIVSRGQLARLERTAHRLDEQACRVQEAAHAAIRHAATPSFGAAPVYGLPGVPEHVARRLPPQVFAQLAAAQTRPVGGVDVRVGGVRVAVGHRGVTGFRPIQVAQPVGPSPAAQALCAQADALRGSVAQLLAVVCG